MQCITVKVVSMKYTLGLYLVHLLSCPLTQMSNRPITLQQFTAFIHTGIIKLKLGIRMVKKGEVTLTVAWLLVSYRYVKTADLLDLYHTTTSGVCRELYTKDQNIK